MVSNYLSAMVQPPKTLILCRRVFKNVPVPVNGYVTAPETPGLGIEIREEDFRNGDAVIETVAEL